MARPSGTKNIETAEKMWEYFEDYRSEVKGNPIHIVEQKRGNTIIPKGYEGEMPDSIVKLPMQRPLTFEGFQNWLDDNDIITDVTDYFENKQERYTDYVRVCARIKRTIRQDQIEGGMCGIYNPSITQRLNNLSETVNSNVSVSSPIMNVDPLSDETDNSTS